jgi:hypothetical protein
VKTFLEAVQQLSTGINELQSYTVNGEDTNLGIYSKVSDPKTIVFYIPGGIVPLGLAMASGKLISRQPEGFTWRLMPLWFNHKIAVAALDFPRKYFNSIMRPAERLSVNRIQTLTHILYDLRLKFPGTKLIGYGHSYGSLEMSELANTTLLDGIIIGSGCYTLGHEDDDDKHAYVSNIESKVPLLIVHHEDDLTPKCFYPDAKKFMDKYAGITIHNGMPHLGDPGFEPGPHYFLSQENEVIKNIVDWINTPFKHRDIV